MVVEASSPQPWPMRLVCACPCLSCQALHPPGLRLCVQPTLLDRLVARELLLLALALAFAALLEEDLLAARSASRCRGKKAGELLLRADDHGRRESHVAADGSA